MPDTERPGTRTLVAFMILIVLAGGNGVGITIIGDELSFRSPPSRSRPC